MQWELKAASRRSLLEGKERMEWIYSEQRRLVERAANTNHDANKEQAPEPKREDAVEGEVWCGVVHGAGPVFWRCFKLPTARG